MCIRDSSSSVQLRAKKRKTQDSSSVQPLPQCDPSVPPSTDTSCEALSQRNPNFGKKPSDKTKLKMGAVRIWRPSMAGMKGKKHSDETKLKMSAAKKRMSDETKLKICAARKGKRMSDETKLKMSAARKC